MIQKEQVKKRLPNWLPLLLPSGSSGRLGVSDEIVVSQDDLFPKGEIAKFFDKQEYGFIKDQHGHDIYFHLNELDFIGPKNDRSFLKAGVKVGYDLSWTSHGLHVKRMKIY